MIQGSISFKNLYSIPFSFPVNLPQAKVQNGSQCLKMETWSIYIFNHLLRCPWELLRKVLAMLNFGNLFHLMTNQAEIQLQWQQPLANLVVDQLQTEECNLTLFIVFLTLKSISNTERRRFTVLILEIRNLMVFVASYCSLCNCHHLFVCPSPSVWLNYSCNCPYSVCLLLPSYISASNLLLALFVSNANECVCCFCHTKCCIIPYLILCFLQSNTQLILDRFSLIVFCWREQSLYYSCKKYSIK